MRAHLSAAILLLTLAACSSLAACGSGSAGTGNTPTMPDADLLALGKQVVQCMRDNGITDMPDPYVEDHRLEIPEDKQESLDDKYTDKQFDTAEDACRSLLDKIPQGAIGKDQKEGPAAPGPADVEALRKYAQCMRDNGVPEWPDPDADGRFPILGTALEKERPDESPRLDKAIESCRTVWSGPVSIS